MRIMFLHMFPLWGNGSGAWLRALATELVKDGHEVAIVAPEKRKLPGVRHFIVTPPQMGVFVGNPELPGAKKYEEMSGVELSDVFTSYLEATIPAVKAFEPHIVHAFHTAFLPAIARIAKVMYGIRYVITTHGSDLHYLSRDRRLLGLLKDAVRVCGVVTANSAFTREWFLDMVGHEWFRKVRTIPGGVYIEQYAKDASFEAKINRKYDLAGKKVVLFTGRLTKHKGVEYLLKAARKIHGEVVVLGDGPERSYLEKMIHDLKLTNVKLLGYMNPSEQKYFRAFYTRANVYVAPSTWDEPLGLVILEAMAAKTPVIVTRKGGAGSLVKDGCTGYLVRARNASQIAEKANYLLTHDDVCKKMGQKAHDVVKKYYTWDRIAELFVRIYEKHSYTSPEYLRTAKGPLEGKK